MQYDLRTEPWITAKTTDGKPKKIGIEKALVNASGYLEYTAPTGVYYDTYAIYRLLVTIVMDIYRPKNQKAIARLFFRKGFPADEVRKYLDRYVWDLYDPEKPFLQYTGKINQKAHPVSSLSPLFQTGNNDLFHMRPPRINCGGINEHPVTLKNMDYKEPEWWNPFTVAEAACTLIRVQFAYGKYGGIQSAFSAINENGLSYPVMALPQGKTAFETLVFSMTTVDKDSKGIPMWARDHYEITDDPLDNFVATAFHPRIYIRLNEPEEDGLVYSTKYAVIKPPKEPEEGAATDIWGKSPEAKLKAEAIREMEPHMIGITGPSSKKYLSTDITRRQWLDALDQIDELAPTSSYIKREYGILRAVYSEDPDAEDNMDRYRYIQKHILYGMTMQGQGSSYSQMRCELKMRDPLIDNLWMRNAVKKYIDRIRLCADVLSAMVMKEYDKDRSFGATLLKNSLYRYYDKARRLFDRYLDNIQGCEVNGSFRFTGDMDPQFISWNTLMHKAVNDLAIDSFNRIPPRKNNLVQRALIKKEYIKYKEEEDYSWMELPKKRSGRKA